MTRKLQISAMILFLLIGIFLYNKNYQSKFESSFKEIFLHKKEDIFKILIQNGNESIEIIKVDTIWSISSNDTLKIKSQSMDNFFNKVLKVNRGTIISSNPEKYEKYSIDDSTGTHLAIINYNGDTMDYYIFGQSKSDYSRSYVRIGKDPNVYLADQNVTYMLQTRPTYWGQVPELVVPNIPSE